MIIKVFLPRLVVILLLNQSTKEVPHSIPTHYQRPTRIKGQQLQLSPPSLATGTTSFQP